jgi:hypothetical protein
VARKALEKVAKRDDPGQPTYSITVILLAMGKDFTAQARAECERMATSAFTYAGVNVIVTIAPMFLGDMLDELWTLTGVIGKEPRGIGYHYQ